MKSEFVKSLFIPNNITMMFFVPFALLAAGFFYSPSTFVGILLPIGGLWYYLLSFIVNALQPYLGPDYVAFGAGFTTLLAITGSAYLYLVACYISYIVKWRGTGTKRLAMAASLGVMFLSPFFLGYVQAALFPPPESTGVPIRYLNEETCRSLSSAGASAWNESSVTCTIKGNVSGTRGAILGISSNTTLVLSGPAGKLENKGGYGYGIINNGTIMLESGANVVNELNSTDPANPLPAVISNRGIVRIGKDSALINRGLIDGIAGNGTISNHGMFENRGNVLDSRLIENYGVLVNYGTISNYDSRARITNYGTAENQNVLSNVGGILTNNGRFDNYGGLTSRILYNYGAFDTMIGTLYAEEVHTFCNASTDPEYIPDTLYVDDCNN